MAWDEDSVRAGAQSHFDNGVKMETGSQGSGSRHSRVRPRHSLHRPLRLQMTLQQKHGHMMRALQCS